MRRTHALLLAVVAAVGCGGDAPSGPATVSGTFDLQAIDGMSLPRIELINMSLDTLFTTGGELRVTTRGRMAVVRRERWHSVSGPGPESADTVIATYRESGSTLLLDYPSTVPRGPYTDTATVTDDAITVRTKIYGQQLGTVFVRDYRYNRR